MAKPIHRWALRGVDNIQLPGNTLCGLTLSDKSVRNVRNDRRVTCQKCKAILKRITRAR